MALAALAVATATLAACAPQTRRTVIRIPETQWTSQRDRERAAEIVAAQEARGERPAAAPAYEPPPSTYRRPDAPLVREPTDGGAYQPLSSLPPDRRPYLPPSAVPADQRPYLPADQAQYGAGYGNPYGQAYDAASAPVSPGDEVPVGAPRFVLPAGTAAFDATLISYLELSESRAGSAPGCPLGWSPVTYDAEFHALGCDAFAMPTDFPSRSRAFQVELGLSGRNVLGVIASNLHETLGEARLSVLELRRYYERRCLCRPFAAYGYDCDCGDVMVRLSADRHGANYQPVVRVYYYAHGPEFTRYWRAVLAWSRAQRAEPEPLKTTAEDEGDLGE